MFDPLDGYHVMMGMPLRPKWREAQYRRWFAFWPVKTEAGWRWLQLVYRRRRWANRMSFTPFGGYYPTTVDHRSNPPA